jgi:hypothetical protein
MRCPECQKFASYGEPQVEALDFGSEEDRVTAEVQVTLVCADDDTELKQGTLEVTFGVEHTCDLEAVVVRLLKETPPDRLGTDDVDKAVADREFEVIDCNVSPLEGMKGKKNLYGATVEWTVTCSACDATVEVSTELEEEASAFEEIA